MMNSYFEMKHTVLCCSFAKYVDVFNNENLNDC